MNKYSKLYKQPIGAQYFKYDENNELILLRLYKVKSENTFLLKDKQKNKVVLTKKQLEEFSMLEPDGLVIHVLASDPNYGIDTLCLLYRLDDIDKDINEPYAVCRQNIVDPFETILNNNSKKIYVGVSISRDTAPADFDFKSVYAASGVRDQKIHFVYKDDSFEDIMSFVNEDLYDKALNIIKSHMDENDNMTYVGFKNTYRELLIENDFMYDFRRAFGIIRLNLTINTSIDSWTKDGVYKISDEEINTIESLTKHKVIAPILIKYDKSVDITEIKRNYLFFEDLNKELYIISYDKGEYINKEFDSLEDQRDRELLQRVICK